MTSRSFTPDILREDRETAELLTASNRSSNNNSSFNLTLNLEKLQAIQQSLTDTWFKKLYQFIRLYFFGKENKLEKFILDNEYNDCSLVSKYSSITRLDLTRTSLSVNELYLNTLYIPHPLQSFTKPKAIEKSKLEDPIQMKNLQQLATDLDQLPVSIFIHGLGGQISQFESLFALLSQCSEIYSLDLPGFGNSKVARNKGSSLQLINEEDHNNLTTSISNMTYNDFQSDNIVQIILSFIEQKIPSHKKIVLIGHSMGTHLSIKLSNRLGNRIESIILLSPPKLIENHHNDELQNSSDYSKSSSMLKFFTYFPRLFECFRIYDRLTGLTSHSVSRQLSPDSALYNKAKQLRWNLDVNSSIILKYVLGAQPATTTQLIGGLSKVDGYSAKAKILVICGDSDALTPPKYTDLLCDTLESLKIPYDKRLIGKCGHSLLLEKPEIISGLVLNFIESTSDNLKPSWVLQVKAKLSGDKWSLKNELKWSKVQPISYNIINPTTGAVSSILALKTLRENDEVHSPLLIEEKMKNSENPNLKNLMAIIDISADLPPYNPSSFKYIKYHKLPTVSKVQPDSTMIRSFIQLMDKIFEDYYSTHSPEEIKDLGLPLVGVHCHYGFNRTGFLICCYLVERLGWSVTEAVSAFKVAREPGIKHIHFIDALYVRYDT